MHKRERYTSVHRRAGIALVHLPFAGQAVKSMPNNSNWRILKNRFLALNAARNDCSKNLLCSRRAYVRLATAGVPCQAVETRVIRSTASFSVAFEDANEKRTKSAPLGPNAAPGMAATPASSSMMRQT